MHSLLAVAVLTTLQATAGDDFAKDVVAAPQDFPLLRLPDPAAAALRSHTALVPVRLEPQADGRFGAQLTLPFDGGQEGRALLAFFAPRPEAWSAYLSTADGTRPIEELARESGARVERRTAALALGQHRQDVEGFLLEGVRPGEVELAIDAATDWNAGDRIDGFVAITGSEELVLETRLLHHELVTGHRVGLSTRLVGTSEAWIDSAVLRLFSPDGSDVELVMGDDGLDGDAVAHDGELAAVWTAGLPGRFVAQVDAVGLRADGVRFRRTTQTLFAVVDVQARIAAANAVVASDQVRIEVATELSGATRVQFGAELWAVDGATETPVAWIGRIAEIDAGEIGIEVEAGRFAGVAGRLELRNARLQDVDTHVVLARAPRVPVSGPRLSASRAERANGRGPTRAQADLLDPTPGASFPPPPPPIDRGLMLVHGYCSGGVWPTGSFTEAATFADFDQNRSHDAFALLLREQGAAAFDSFGVVAHSQGGAAALHLLTFYESGLDLARGERLIQSLGTPYQGTPLAGNVAVLGDIFGVGCGTSTDLATDGALLWLANIPSKSRARVHYYTTSYTEPAGFFANCNFAANLVLTNPEDGTTEKFRGQLPGANDEGHIDGWCHTTGMSDPAQYLDGARNAVMNQRAAR